MNDKRPCVTHCNFMSAAAIDKMAKHGIVADLQPAWLYLDGRTLLKQFGNERLEYFQPYKTLAEKGVVAGGGSDHMQKVGSMRSVNPYNPFLGMWTTLTRHPRWMGEPIRTEQIIGRAEAIRLYTINNAWLTFEEKEKGVARSREARRLHRDRPGPSRMSRRRGEGNAGQGDLARGPAGPSGRRLARITARSRAGGKDDNSVIRDGRDCHLDRVI